MILKFHKEKEKCAICDLIRFIITFTLELLLPIIGIIAGMYFLIQNIYQKHFKIGTRK